MKYEVEITETLQRVVEVEASSAEDAERQIRATYRAGAIVLNAEDCMGVEIVSRLSDCTRFP
jgi:hypothetical protein